ncbi:MAG: hypothetical protein V7646_4631 [Pseudonocardia sp.]|jgi:hypothetical protein
MPYLLQAASCGQDLWVRPNLPGAPKLGLYLNADGLEIHQLVADGALDQALLNLRARISSASTRRKSASC